MSLVLLFLLPYNRGGGPIDCSFVSLVLNAALRTNSSARVIRGLLTCEYVDATTTPGIIAVTRRTMKKMMKTTIPIIENTIDAIP